VGIFGDIVLTFILDFFFSISFLLFYHRFAFIYSVYVSFLFFSTVVGEWSYVISLFICLFVCLSVCVSVCP